MPPEASTQTNDLETRLKKADVVANKYKKQLVVLQSKLEDALSGQERQEETMTTNIERIELLMQNHQVAVKQNQEMQNKYETDKAALLRDKEGAVAREEELTNVIRHLKDTLASREHRRSGEHERGRSSRYGGFDLDQFVASADLVRTDTHRGRDYDRGSPTYPRSSSVGPLSPSAARKDSSQNFARLLRHKDRLIEQLQLELAEAQVKMIDLENQGGDKIHELERMLVDTRVHNAKLLEEKDYYQTMIEEQMVMQEQMLRSRAMTSHSASTISASSSVSQQLSRETPASSVYGGSEISTANEQVRKLETQVNTLQDENKALTQYVDTIVSKLMQHESFEPLLVDGSVTGDNPLAAAATAKENVPPSLLKRAGSIFGGRTRPPRPTSFTNHGSQERPKEQSPQRQVISPISDVPLTAITSRPSPNPNEEPLTGTRVPIRRPLSVRVGSNEWSLAAANAQYRPNGTTSRQTSGQTSPQDQPNRRTSYFNGISLHPNALNPETASIMSRATSDSGTHFSDAPSTPAISEVSTAAPIAPTQSHASGGLHRSGTVIASGTNPRPLRLVQEKVEADAAARRANRQSWRGWFGKGGDPPINVGGAVMGPPPPPYQEGMQGTGPGAAPQLQSSQGQAGAQVWPGQREVYERMTALQAQRERERGVVSPPVSSEGFGK